MNLGNDYASYTTIFVGDTTSEFGHYTNLYKGAGILIDSINPNKLGDSRLVLSNKQLQNGKEIKFVSSYKEYTNLVGTNPKNRVLLVFSRIHFNKKHDEGVFTIDFSCSYNAGSDFTIYIKKENNHWELKRILETAIR